MSTIYSAGQYDDAFTPKRLGNWESTAKESFPFRKTPKLYTPKPIVDGRGHLLPWVPRGDRTSSWGLLNLHLRNKYHRGGPRSMVFMSGPGKQDGSSHSIQKRLKKIPKFIPRKMEHGPPPDLLLEYLQHLSLPIVWIIGPCTKNTFQKRKQFSKQLASSLGFGYVNLDDKIQEWKERQQICTCGGSTSTASTSILPSSPPPAGPLHSLASTSIAPSKLPTNVPPFISANIPSPPPETGAGDASEYLLSILESQRIAFDTAMPIERNKILELYKFAMAECLPCGGFILDSVPFDLVEGLQFEKVFYPAALAIYFTEGVPQKKQRLKPKDRRVTANNTSNSIQGSKKVLMSPLDYLERGRSKHAGENVYLKTKNHKRLGIFSTAEGDKICRQFGSKTIRIINAEDVERETMEFLNELVKKNLDKYPDIINGVAKLDFGVGSRGQLIRCPSAAKAPSPISSEYASSFILEEDERKLLELDELEAREAEVTKSDMPPPLVTAHHSDTSLFTLPNIFSESSSVASSVMASPRTSRHEEPLIIEDAVQEKMDVKPRSPQLPPPQSRGPSFLPVAVSDASSDVGAGDHAGNTVRKKSAELWERIVKLESKVAEVRPPEERCIQLRESKACCSLLLEDENDEEECVNHEVDLLPPPTAYAEQEYLGWEEQEKLTSAIRNAISSNCVQVASSQRNQDDEYRFAPQNYPSHYPNNEAYPNDYYDYGASGDCGGGEHYHPSHHQLPPLPNNFHQQQKKRSPLSSNDKQSEGHSSSSFQEDPFYD